MKYLGVLLLAALFLAVPLSTAYHYAPHQSYHHGQYDGADVVFRGEVTRIQRLGGSDPRVEVTMRVRERIRGSPSSTITLVFPRYRDYYRHYTDDVPLVDGREYVIGARRSDSRYRLVWYEPVSHYRPPSYAPHPYQPPFYAQPRPVGGITIPNPDTTNTCTVLDVSGQVVVVCPSTQQHSRLAPLAIGEPQPTVRIVDSRPAVPIAAFPWLH